MNSRGLMPSIRTPRIISLNLPEAWYRPVLLDGMDSMKYLKSSFFWGWNFRPSRVFMTLIRVNSME
jgi:hypothetical protein